jgi:hypothetical protein
MSPIHSLKTLPSDPPPTYSWASPFVVLSAQVAKRGKVEFKYESGRPRADRPVISATSKSAYGTTMFLEYLL